MAVSKKKCKFAEKSHQINTAMIQEIQLQSFGPITNVNLTNLQNINLLIGKNGSGKTFTLKALYCALKTVEQYKRGKEFRSQKELLADGLYWTFQPKTLGALVKKGASSLHFSMLADKETFSYSLGQSTTRNIPSLIDTFAPTQVNNVFIPAKEIVSLQDIILRAYDVDKEFGFDKSYVDLARALSKTTKGKNLKEFAKARKQLTEAVGGRLEYDEKQQTWIFRNKERQSFEINLASEGIKRLSILDLLLGNHYLTRDSIIIIDEAEANLHPALVSQFMNILVQLAQAGLQLFISTHSYFVIKNLYILAHEHNISVPTFSFTGEGIERGDLLEEMPDNPIIQESINLYQREIDL